MRISCIAGKLHWSFAVGIIAAVWLSPTAVAYGIGERDALWRVVEDLCLPMHRTLGLALPCLEVDATKGFIVLRAPADETRILVVPTAKIEGIESPALLNSETPNLWSIAWSERNRVAASASRTLAWADMGMAVNSRTSRTQDQLHIHVDCIDARLKRALSTNASRISKKWSNLDLRPWADHYRVKRIGAQELDRGIFQMVANEIPGARAHMGMQSIAVVGDDGEKGDHDLVVLVNGQGGHAEELLDHKCLKGK